jgi:hypothetical protein
MPVSRLYDPYNAGLLCKNITAYCFVFAILAEQADSLRIISGRAGEMSIAVPIIFAVALAVSLSGGNWLNDQTEQADKSSKSDDSQQGKSGQGEEASDKGQSGQDSKGSPMSRSGKSGARPSAASKGRRDAGAKRQEWHE